MGSACSEHRLVLQSTNSYFRPHKVTGSYASIPIQTKVSLLLSPINVTCSLYGSLRWHVVTYWSNRYPAPMDTEFGPKPLRTIYAFGGWYDDESTWKGGPDFEAYLIGWKQSLGISNGWHLLEVTEYSEMMPVTADLMETLVSLVGWFCYTCYWLYPNNDCMYLWIADPKFLEFVIAYWDYASLWYVAYCSGMFWVGGQILLGCWSERVGSSWNVDDRLEVLWTLFPSFILLLMASSGIGVLYALDLSVADCSIVFGITGHQWYWSYELLGLEYESRMVCSKSLPRYAPRLIMVDSPLLLPVGNVLGLGTATDVIHSYSLPSLGVKLDCIPGRTSLIRLSSSTAGSYCGQCTELCGSGHSVMPIQLILSH